MKFKFFPIFGSLILLMLCSLGILYPWWKTAAEATLSGITGIVDSIAGERAIQNSVLVSVVSVIGAGVLGTLLAIALRYVQMPAPRMARLFVTLPLALPPLVGAASFYFLLSEGGMIPRFVQMITGIDAHTLHIEGFWAVAAIHAHAFFVYFYFFVDDALESVDRSEIEAARQLGAHGWSIALRIVFPHLRPALTRAALLVFIASLASFSAPLLFGGGMRFLTTEIYNAKLNGSTTDAASYAMLLSAASLLLLLVARARKSGGKGTGVRYVRQPGRFDSLFAIGTWIVLGIVALPPAMLILLAFTEEGAWTTQILPPAYTFDHVVRLFTNSSAWQPIITSIGLAVVTVATTLTIAFAVALCTARSSIPLIMRRLLELTTTLPAAIPGTVVGINILIAFSVPHFFTGNMVLTGTSVVLVLAYVTRTLPFAVQGLSAGYAGIHASIEEAAASLGAGSMRTARRIIIPMLAPAIVSSAVYTFVTAFGEFPASTLLFTPLSRPASIEILQHLRLFDLGSAAALGVLMILISSVAIFVGRDRHIVVLGNS